MNKSVLALLAGAVVVAGVMTGCSNGQGVAKLVTPQDSAAYYLGVAQTMPLVEQWERFQFQVPGDSATKQSQFIQGFRDAIKGDAKKAAYSHGYIMASQIIDGWEGFNAQVPGDSLELKTFVAGLLAGLQAPKDTAFTADMASAYWQAYYDRAKKEVEDRNKQAGDDFLAANKSKEGVVELPSGLQYRIDKLGEGAKPAAEDTVVVNYIGTKLDGTVFDSSYDRGEPATFALTGVIQGFSEGLQQVPAGSKVTLWIPGELAYGARGAGQDIGPYEMLTFEMELLEVHPAASAKK